MLNFHLIHSTLLSKDTNVLINLIFFLWPSFSSVNSRCRFVFLIILFFLIFQLIHGLVDRIMEVIGAPFVSVGVETGYYIKCSDVSGLFRALYFMEGYKLET